MEPEKNFTLHRITVLLVDDQQLIGETVRRMLIGERDIDFHYCQDPTRAIKMANTVAPTVILQDLVMPEMDGLRLVRYFRANRKTREVPLIVLSSKEDPEIKAKAFGLGANDYMVKLPDRLEVIARIRYHSKGYINMLERDEAYQKLDEAYQEVRKSQRLIRQTFGRYLSDEVVEELLSHEGEGAQLGGDKRRLTILMSDLRGFTAISERLPAEKVLGIINIYLEAMIEIILKYQGTIDEFIGDAILVIFGAPILREDDARRAVACALEMQLAMEAVNERNRATGFPEVAQGIGINTGDLVVGNIGSEKRSKYGVVGQCVNLTSRIESYTVGGQILISDSTCEACGDILRIDDRYRILPKGFKTPVNIYEIGGIGGRYGLYLSEKTPIELTPLTTPLPIRFTALEGKLACETMLEGEVVRTGKDMVEVRSDSAVEWLTDLRISLIDSGGREITEEVYGKVIKLVGDAPPVFRIRFTSVPPEADTFLKGLIEPPGTNALPDSAPGGKE
jgi:adenylate cyclase